MLHELGHAIGLYHEHNRPDRDQFIKILWGNIRGGSDSNFKINRPWLVNLWNIPYDYTSVMHYSKTVSKYFY